MASAAVDGREDEIRALVAKGVDPDGTDERGITPLMWAARSGRVGSIEALVQGGAQLDRRDTHVNGWTPLMHAIHKGQAAAVKRLLELGADPGLPAWNGLTPLIMAAGEGDLDLVRELLDRGADPCAESNDHLNALTGAVAGGNLDVMKLLMERAPGLRWNDNLEGFGARAAAWFRGDKEIVRLVCEARRRGRGNSGVSCTSSNAAKRGSAVQEGEAAGGEIRAVDAADPGDPSP